MVVAVPSRALVLRLEVGLPVSALTVVGLQVQPWVVSAGGVAEIISVVPAAAAVLDAVVVVLWEAVLVLPALGAAGLDLGDGDVLLPVVGPIKFSLKTQIQEGSRFEINATGLYCTLNMFCTIGLNFNLMLGTRTTLTFPGCPGLLCCDSWQMHMQ